MAEWRERGYVPDSDDEEDDQWRIRPSEKDASASESVQQAGGTQQERAGTGNYPPHNEIPQEPLTARKTAEHVDSITMEDCRRSTSQNGPLALEGSMSDLADGETILDKQNKEQTVPGDERSSEMSVADQLEAVLNSSLQTVHEFLNSNPIAPANPTLPSSGSSSPLSSLEDFDEGMDLGGGEANLTAPVNDLHKAIHRDPGSILHPNVMEQDQRRGLRQRKAIQVHPYALEDARYQETLKARGLKPLRLVESDTRVHSPAALDTQYESLLSSSQADMSTSPVPSLPPLDEHGIMPVHYDGDSDEESPIDLGMENDADGLPDVSDILNGRRIISTSTRKKSRTRSKSSEVLPTGDHFRVHDLPNEAPGTDFSRTATEDMFYIPPSPPQSAGLNDQTSSSAEPKQSKARPYRTPRALLTPILSSENQGRKRSVIELIDSSNTSQADISGDDLSSVSSETGSQQVEKLTEIRRRIKGVLPASWLRLDLKKQNSHQVARAALLSPVKSTETKGVARYTSSTLHHFHDAEPRRPGDETLANDLVSEDDWDDHASDVVAHEHSELGVVAQSDDWMDDVVEDNVVDSMAQRAIRKRGSLEKPRKGQKTSKDSWRRRTGPHSSGFTSVTKMIETDDRDGEKQSRRIRRNHKRQRVDSPIHQLSILDAPGFRQPPTVSQPRFLKIAARRARRQKDKGLQPGYQHPQRKHFNLADRVETEEINQDLLDWQSGRTRLWHHHRNRQIESEEATNVPRTSANGNSRSRSVTGNPSPTEPSSEIAALKGSTNTTLQRLFFNRRILSDCATGQDRQFSIKSLPETATQVVKLAVQPAARPVVPNQSKQGYLLPVSTEPRPAQVETPTWQNSASFRPRLPRKHIARYMPVPASPPTLTAQHSQSVDTIRTSLILAHTQCMRATGPQGTSAALQDTPDKVVREVVRKYKDNEMKEISSKPDPGLPEFLQSLVAEGFPTYFPIEAQDTTFHVCLKVLAMTICGFTSRLRDFGPDPAETKRMQKVVLGKLQSFVFALSPNSGETLQRDKALSLADLAATTNRCSLYATLYAYSPPVCRPRLGQVAALVDIARSHNEACRVILRTWETLVGYQISRDDDGEKLEEFSGWIQAIIDQTVSKYHSAEEEVTTQLRTAGALVDQYALTVIQANQQSTIGYLVLVLGTWEKIFKTCRTATQVRHLLSVAAVDKLAVLCETSLDSGQASSLAAINVFIACLEKLCLGFDADTVGETDMLVLLKSRIWKCLPRWFDPQDPTVSANGSITRRLTECWSLIAYGDVLSRKASWDEYIEPAGLSSWERIASNETCRQCKIYFVCQVIRLNKEAFTSRTVELLLYWIVGLLQPSERLRHEHKLTAEILKQECWTYRLLDNIPDWFLNETTQSIDLEDLLHARRPLLVQMVENIASVSASAASSEDSQDKLFLLTEAELSSILKTMMKTMRNAYESLNGQSASQGDYSILVRAVVQEMFNKTRHISEIDPWFFENLGISQVGRLFHFQAEDGGTGHPEGRVSIQQVQWLQSRALSTALRGSQQSLLDDLQSLFCNRACNKDHILENRYLQLVVPVYVRKAFEEPADRIVRPILRALHHTFKYCLFKPGFSEGSNLVSFANATFAVIAAAKDAFSGISGENILLSVSRTKMFCSVLDFLGLALLQCDQVRQVVPRGVPSRSIIRQYARYFFAYARTLAFTVHKDHPLVLGDQSDDDNPPIDLDAHVPAEASLSPEDAEVRHYATINLEKALRSWSKDTAGVWWAQQGPHAQRVPHDLTDDHAAAPQRLSKSIEMFATQLGKIVKLGNKIEPMQPDQDSIL